MTAKKAVKTTKSAPAAKPVNPLANKAEAVLERHHLEWSGDGFEPAPRDEEKGFAFYEDHEPLAGSCAVIELYNFSDADDDLPDLPEEDLIELFKYSVQKTLASHNRKQAIATTTRSQEDAVMLLKAAGFVSLGSARNPSSENTVTIWALSI